MKPDELSKVPPRRFTTASACSAAVALAGLSEKARDSTVRSVVLVDVADVDAVGLAVLEGWSVMEGSIDCDGVVDGTSVREG